MPDGSDQDIHNLFLVDRVLIYGATAFTNPCIESRTGRAGLLRTSRGFEPAAIGGAALVRRPRSGSMPASMNGRCLADKVEMSGWLLGTLATVYATASVAMLLCLPAFPDMTTEFHAPVSALQLALTGFLVGSGAGQLLFGVLADRFGRKPPLISGMLGCAWASAVAPMSPNIEALILGMTLQGFFAGAGIVIVNAIVTDVVGGADAEATRAFNTLFMLVGLAPAVAPLLGSALIPIIGWRGIFWVMTAFTLALAATIMLFVPETRPPEPRGTTQRGSLALLSRPFLANAMTVVFGFAALMAYTSASPFVYQCMMGLDRTDYALLHGVNLLGFAGVAALSARLAHKCPQVTLLAYGLSSALSGSLILVALALSPLPSVWLAPAIFAVVTSLGCILGTATARTMRSARSAASRASALIGTTRYLAAALIAPVVGLGGHGTAVPLAATMAVCLAIAATCQLVALNTRKRV